MSILLECLAVAVAAVAFALFVIGLLYLPTLVFLRDDEEAPPPWL